MNQSRITKKVALSLRSKKTRDFLTLLREGCHRTCDYDEAEGGIISHCSICQREITRMAYELFA